MEHLLLDAGTYVTKVVGTWDELLVRLAVEGGLATAAWYTFRRTLRLSWKPPEVHEHTKKPLTSRVKKQKGWGSLLAHAPIILVADLVHLGVIFCRGIHISPPGRGNVDHPSSTDEVSDD